MKLRALLALSALAGASQLAAQEAPAEPAGVSIRVSGTPLWQRGEPFGGDLMRRVEEAAPVFDWFADDDAALQPIAPAAGQRYRRIDLVLDVAADGTASACDSEESDPEAKQWVPGLCDLLTERARFKPALDDTGSPAADRYKITLSVRRVDTTQGFVDKPQGLVERPQDPLVPPPAPPPPPPALDSDSAWPINAADLRTRERPQFRRAPEQVAVGAIPEGTPAVVVMIETLESGALRCVRIGDLGTQAQAAEACDRIENRLKPTWPRGAMGFRSQYPILAIGSGRAMRVVAPSADATWRPPMSTETARASLAAAQDVFEGGDVPAGALWLKADGYGTVTDCFVRVSFGSDEADIGLCAAMRATTFDPLADAFGVPTERIVYWSPGNARRYGR